MIKFSMRMARRRAALAIAVLGAAMSLFAAPAATGASAAPMAKSGTAQAPLPVNLVCVLTVCNEILDEYNEVTNGIGTYGIENLITGKIRIVGKIRLDLRTSLNGRSARYKLTVTVLQGPPISGKFILQCVPASNSPSNVCFKDAWKTGYTRSWNTGAKYLQGEKIKSSGYYRSYVGGSFTSPDETETWDITPMYTSEFYCPAGGGDCFFEEPAPPPTVTNVPGGGSFLTVWRGTGGATGPLGNPTGNWQAIAGGQEQAFQHGGIYWSRATGTHEVQGTIATEYAKAGGPRGGLGFPTSNEVSAPGGGQENTFAGASCGSGSAILWTPATGAHEIQGCIYDAYLKRFGGPGGPYGYPIRDEAATKGGGGRVSYTAGTACGSAHGSGLFWSHATQTQPVRGCFFQRYEQIGEDRSGLGFPTSGEYATAAGTRQDYQNGYMLSTASGTTVVYGSGAKCANYGPYGTGPGDCAAGFSATGAWFGGGGVGLDGKEIWTYANGTKVSSTAIYQLHGLATTRSYQIQAYIPNGHSDATRAHYTITSPGGGTANAYVDQENFTNAWANVGRVCTSDGTAKIVLSDDGGDQYPLQVGADAIRAVPIALACRA